MKKNAVVPLFLLVALAVGGTPSAAAQPLKCDSGQAQADSFLDRARSSLDAGAVQEAGDLLKPALEIAPEYSEALFLRARIELADRSTTLAAVDDLRRALVSATWNVTDPFMARQMLAEVFLRMGRLADARALLVGLAARDPHDPRNSLLLARLYARQGNIIALRLTLSDALAKFPLDDEIALLSADLREREGQRPAARQLIATHLSVHPDSLGLLLRAAQLEPTPGAKVAAVDRYVRQGGKDPLAAVVALEAPTRDPKKYLSQFIDNGGLSRQDLVERVAAVASGSRSLSAAFRSALSEYSGNRDLDPDGEGYVERWTFEKGAPVSWVRDSSRDGQPKYTARFRGGAPVSLTVRAGSGAPFTFGYGSYPFVQSMTEPEPAGEGTRSWLVSPFTVRFPFLSGRPTATGLAPRTLGNPGSASADRIRQSAYREEDHSADGSTIVRRIDLDRGRRVFLEEDTLGTGRFDHRVWYENGQPVRGARDLDGSGRYLLSETWRNGRLAAVAVDTRGDGKVSYRERYVPSPVKSWDFNEDGIDDSREYPLGPHTIERDFSTALNGIFDVSFVWKDADLVGVKRRGMSVPVTHDAARGVVWIGRPAPERAVFDRAGPQGYRAIGGRLYVVFDREDVTYAEEVP
ncbi:MAG TPA: tetratricopeptide repeat protein [Spirochaetia bacterium]|nr:tetratricopeptide repeat protein [Spirochaetia bacterium]